MHLCLYLDSLTITSIDTRTRIGNAIVWWNVPDSMCVVFGFVVRYKALKKRACRESLQDSTYSYKHVSKSHRAAGIPVEPHTLYQIGLAAKFRNDPPLTSLQWINRRKATPQSAPPSPVINLVKAKSTQLEFTWDQLTCSNVNGNLSHYRATLEQTDGPAKTKEISAETSTVTFRNLEPCTEYHIALSAVNSHHEGTPTLLHAWTKAKVIDARVDQQGVTSLSAVWDLPEQCKVTESEIQYSLMYERIGLAACTSQHVINRNQITRSSITSTSYELTDLQPFTDYKIRISIIDATHDEKSSSSSFSSRTMPGAPDPVEYLRIQLDRGNQWYKFHWVKPGCEGLHGHFRCYDYILFRGTGSNAAVKDKNKCTTEPNMVYYFDNLQACTVYQFQVRVVTLTYGLERRSSWKNITAQQTPTQAPGAPRSVVALQSLQPNSEAEIRWDIPIDHPCNPDEYYVTCQLLYEDMCKEPSLRTLNSTTIRPTDTDQTTIRSTIGGLLPYSKYKVCVLGRNEGGDGPSKCVNLTTGVEAPSSTPTRVNCTRSWYDSLTFTWDKPPCGDRKGPISWYEFRLNDRESSQRKVGNVTGDENTVTITSLRPSRTFTFKVRAVNNLNQSGSYARLEAHTLTAVFHPPTGVAVTWLNESTAGLQWSAPNTSDLNIVAYRIVWWESGFKDKTVMTVPRQTGVCDSGCLLQDTIIGLKSDTTHFIQVITGYEYGGEAKSNVVEFRTPQKVRMTSSRQGATMIPVLVTIFVIIVVLLLVIAVMLYTRKNDWKLFSLGWLPISYTDIRNAVRGKRSAPGKSRQTPINRKRCHAEGEQNGSALEMQITGGVSQANNYANQEVESNLLCPIYENTTAQFSKHQVIPVGQFLEYVARRNADRSNSLDDDFKNLPSQELHSQDIALKEQNKEKNRFKNILPYDHSRVTLSVVDGDPHSDYINASFIDGYETPKKYIAAQGPNTASVDSFWRMVWQCDSRKIVMLTNLREANKKKCEKYWPAESDKYGSIWITMRKEEIHDLYTIRYFNLVCNNTARDVVQYHYTSWPDMGVPEFSAHLMSFVRITREPLKSHHKGPTIVHCSAGVGRTGTFLTLDAMLDQIQSEQSLDIHSFIIAMRQNRPLMVQTKKQYRFIYEALLQDLTSGDTGISRSAFDETYKSLMSKGMAPIKQQFELLQALTVSPTDDDTAAARNDENSGKNRFTDKVPSGRTRPFLMTEVEGGNDYINASFLPGYVSNNQYIGTQTPLPNTVVDFWRLIVDYKVNTIVMLHGNSRDQTYAQYWPTEGSKRFGPYTVNIVKEEYNRPIMHRTLEVTETDSKKASSKNVKQLQLASCPPQSDTPPRLSDVMDLHRALLSALGTTVWKEGDSSLLIHCRDGEGMTGAFCGFLAVLDHLDAKQTVDVFHACRKIRTSRPGAVASLGQYEFIYEAVKSFMISSSIYENMAKIV